MIRRILSIAGKPGLYRLVNQGKNMLIVEQLNTGKRMPAYARDKVISLGDISIYTLDGDVPLAEVFEKVSAKTEGKPVDLKQFVSDQEMRAFFGEILPSFDDERVYSTDIKKLFSWFNLLLSAGITEFVDKSEEAEEEGAEEAAPEA